MFYQDKARLDKSTYKSAKKEKHFICTRCDNECSHVTTSKTVCGVDIIPEDEAFCKRCTTYWEKKFINRMITKIEEDAKNKA